MKCKCSLNNNYEVIGLCDIEEFNKKIARFKDTSWTQLVMPEKIIIPPSKPPIKTIMKVFLDIKITSTKIIETPSSNNPNIEGLTLTGKILLVSGDICQNIFYASENYGNSLHSIKSNNPFSTYIALKENLDLEYDTFCVYPCIENISVKILDNRTLSKSLNLLLFAHQTTETFLNSFILKTFDTDKEMLKITFNKRTKKLVVTSTGEIYNEPLAIRALVFEFQILKGTQAIITERIQGMEDANSFRNKVNDFPFEYDDIVRIRYRDKAKVILTDYPNQRDTYSMIPDSFQSFKITETGVVPDLLPNEIILKNSKNETVVKIQIDKSVLIFLITSTGSITDNGGRNYFKFSLLDWDNRTELFSSTITGNSNGNNFRTTINDQHFQMGLRIKLEYEDRSKVTITNFPNVGSPDYNPTGNTQSFVITMDGLTQAP